MGRRVVVCSDVLNGISRNVEAYIKDGCLEIEGQDLGAYMMSDDGEYEYYYSFSKEETRKFADLISNGSMDTFLHCLKDRFGGSHWYFKFTEFCESNDLHFTGFSC
jgi:hypothetical protein